MIIKCTVNLMNYYNYKVEDRNWARRLTDYDKVSSVRSVNTRESISCVERERERKRGKRMSRFSLHDVHYNSANTTCQWASGLWWSSFIVFYTSAVSIIPSEIKTIKILLWYILRKWNKEQRTIDGNKKIDCTMDVARYIYISYN